MVGIVDYGMGNLKSLANALDYLSIQNRFCKKPEDITDTSHLIIPGVGNYAQAMFNLNKADIIPALRAHVANGRPLLGICLGMQILSTTGSETKMSNGINIISGDVVVLSKSPAKPIPHVGWNSVEYRRKHPVVSGIKERVDFYFVHSYYFKVTDQSDVVGITEYNCEFCSIVARGSAIGVQFHPEKSQDQGLKLLENFASWDGIC
jgi:glutamine amidotransferase